MLRGILETRADVGLFEEWIVFENLRFRGAAREHVQHILHPEPIVPDTWPSAALFRVESDAVGKIHGGALAGS